MAGHWHAVFSVFFALFSGFLVGRMWTAIWGPRPRSERRPGATLFGEGLLRRITLHEAGHAIAAWCCTDVVRLVSVSLHEEGGHVGYGTTPSETPNSNWCRMVISLAGLAAETTEFPKVRSGYAMDDLVKARNFAASCVGTSPPWKDPGGKTLPFASMLKPPLTVDEASVLSVGYRMAKHIVWAHGDRVSKLASLVAARGSIGQAEMTNLLGSRVFIALSGMLRSTFVLPKRRHEEERAA